MKAILIALFLTLPLFSSDLDFKEEFADPATRAASLSTLIPGTRDWYFYHALHQQLSTDWQAFERTMTDWKSASSAKLRPISSDGYRTLEQRELLLRYQAHPEKSLTSLIEQLNLDFDDSRPDAREVEKLPDSLDPSLIDAKAFEQAAALGNNENAWQAHTPDQLLADLQKLEEFSEPRIRHSLRALKRADHPGVLQLVLRGLEFDNPVSFGDAPLHQLLSLSQLKELYESQPTLLSNSEFVVSYLQKQRRHKHADFSRDPALHAAFLQQCRDFASKLPPALVSLKAHILYHHLRLQRELGNFPLNDFLTYLAIPRKHHSILRRAVQKDFADPSLSTDFDQITSCPPVGDDDPLIDSLLLHFLAKSESANTFAPYIPKESLSKIHARARLLAGADPQRWGQMLEPAEFATLLEETHLDFAPGRAILLERSSAVKLELDLKNTPELLIRIYELDIQAILTREGHEPNAQLDLDGLVPHHSRQLRFPQAPLVLHRETIELPELDQPGAWIIEFVAKDRACRALLRKGHLIPYLQRHASSQSLLVFDENGLAVTDATLSFGPAGATFHADSSGRITIPNSDTASATQGILSSGNIAQIFKIGRRSDAFELDAKVHLDREQLRADSRATARTQLHLSNHGQQLPLERLIDPSLTLTATLASGVTTEHVISDDLEIAPSFTLPFQVPADTLKLTLKFSATLIPRDGADPVKLQTEHSFAFNSLLEGLFTHAQFTTTPAGHQLIVLGRNGEALPNRAIEFTFIHRSYNNSTTITTRLRSNDAGRIQLGKLESIRQISASHNHQTLATLSSSDLHPSIQFGGPIRIASGEKFTLPRDASLSHNNYSLLELDIYDRPRSDHFGKLSADASRIHIQGLTPGHYHFRSPDNAIRIEVLDTKLQQGLFVSPDRIAPRQLPATPLATRATIDGEQIVIHTSNTSPGTRIHLIGSRFIHPWNDPSQLVPFSPSSAPIVTPGFIACSYLSERQLDEEMRYILDRRAEKTYPGAMLPRAGLLTQRWSKNDIETEHLDLLEGHDGSLSGGGDSTFFSRKAQRESKPNQQLTAGSTPDFIDYLAHSSELQYDLHPAKDGRLKIPLSAFKGCQIIQLIVTDSGFIQQQTIALPQNPIPRRDRRLARSLDPTKHHLGTRRAAALAQGASASIENILDADWRAFTTLGEAQQFLYGATGGEALRELSFLLSWPELDQQDKLTHWAEHACHELNIFLARKDPKFFDKHVKPMLAEKSEPSFIDDLLLQRDLSKYLRPFAWQRLNAAEKALLASPIFRPAPDDAMRQQRIQQQLANRWELEAPKSEQQTILFTQTLRSTDLATRDSLSFDKAGSLSGLSLQSAGATYIVQKLKNIIIPVIDFEDTTLEEAIDYLRTRTVELDTLELDPSMKGLNFVIRHPTSTSKDDELFGDFTDPSRIKIPELRLRNIPINEVLNYICQATRMRWSSDEFAIVIKPATETSEDLITRSFGVPPDFIERIQADNSSQRNVVEALKLNGVPFPQDSSASFFRKTGTLLVRNTPTNLDIIESIISACSADGSADSQDDPFAAGIELNSGGILPATGRAVKRRPSWSSQRDQTRLWLESNYYRHTGSTDESLIPLNAFWLDLAKWNGQGSFLSPNFNACTHSVNEALMCLALLDLPFTAERPDVTIDGSSLQVKARQAMLLFYKDTRITDQLADDSPLLVRQTFHRLDDRFRNQGARKIENTITGNFQSGVAYGASLVVTNPSGVGRRIDVLAQIPAGAIALASSATTLSETRELEPYGVLSLDLSFYFPAEGKFTLYPMQVAENDIILASAEARSLQVKSGITDEDLSSWPVLVREGSDAEVLAYLRSANLHCIELPLIRWRLQQREFFLQASAILRQRLIHSQAVSSYGFHHAEPTEIRNWLENSPRLFKLGAYLDSPLLRIHPVDQLGWQNYEFDPLINPRAHRLGDHPRLQQATALQHYTEYLEQLGWKPKLTATDQLQLTWFLFLQDRIGPAIDRFAKIKANELRGKLPYDYLHALVLFHQSQPAAAKTIAIKHPDLPPGPWRQRFDAVIDQAKEIAALSKSLPTPEISDRESAPSLDLKLAADGKLQLNHQRLKQVDLKLYQVDLEMLFSKNPFLQSAGKLPGTRPKLDLHVKLTGDQTTIDLPAAFRHGNILVSADTGFTKTLKILDSQAIEFRHNKAEHNLQILDAASGLPLPSSYVKVYTENNGQPIFHKDGYTDLRGKFDYLTLSDGQPPGSKRIAIFVSHPEKGSRTLILE